MFKEWLAKLRYKLYHEGIQGSAQVDPKQSVEDNKDVIKQILEDARDASGKIKSITIDIPKFALKPEWEEVEHKLAHLLLKNVIFCNNGWWHEEEGTPWQKDHVTLHVNCNDVFAWGCADSEDITYAEIDELYQMWVKDHNWGPAAWCIKKRKQMPQPPLEKIFREKGIWNLEELINGQKAK